MRLPLSPALLALSSLHVADAQYVEQNHGILGAGAYSECLFTDHDGDGDLDLFVSNVGGCGGSSDGMLYFNDGAGNFEANYFGASTVISSHALAGIDYDRDGRDDIVFSGHSSDGREGQLLRSRGRGQYQRVSLPFDIDPSAALASADVNGDGLADLFVSHSGGSSSEAFASIYIARPDTGYVLDTLTGVRAGDEGHALFFDLDNDGDQDLFYCTDRFYQPFATVLVNDGTGAFTELSGLPFAEAGIRAVESLDANGDGFSDLLFGSYRLGQASEAVALFLNVGGRGFARVEIPAVRDYYSSEIGLAAGDFDGDGDDDFMIAGRDPNFSGPRYVDRYRNDGAGGFAREEEVGTAAFAASASAEADVDRDGRVDVYFAGTEKSFFVNEVLRNGGGSFEETPSGSSGGSSELVDLDGDGHLDLVSSSGCRGDGVRIEVYLGRGDGTFSALRDTLLTGPPGVPSDFEVVDLDGDGFPDIIGYTGYSGYGLAVLPYYNRGDGTFHRDGLAGLRGLWEGYYDERPRFGQFDGQPGLDFVVQVSDTRLEYFLQEQHAGTTPTFSAGGSVLEPEGLDDVAVADLVGDSLSDLVILKRHFATVADSVVILQNLGGGQFEGATSVGAARADALYVIDRDGDGALDIIAMSARGYGRGFTTVFANDGHGGFRALDNQVGLPSDMEGATFADIDGDGDVDILKYHWGYGGSSFDPFAVLLHEAGGYVVEPIRFEAVPYEVVRNARPAFGDIDGDGDLDFVSGGSWQTGFNYTKVIINTSPVSSAEPVHVPDAPALQLSIFPNPARDKAYVTVEGTSLASQASVRICDAVGRVVHDGRFAVSSMDNPYETPLERFAPGVYVVTVQLDRSVLSRPLIVER